MPSYPNDCDGYDPDDLAGLDGQEGPFNSNMDFFDKNAVFRPDNFPNTPAKLDQILGICLAKVATNPKWRTHREGYKSASKIIEEFYTKYCPGAELKAEATGVKLILTAVKEGVTHKLVVGATVKPDVVSITVQLDDNKAVKYTVFKFDPRGTNRDVPRRDVLHDAVNDTKSKVNNVNPDEI